MYVTRLQNNNSPSSSSFFPKYIDISWDKEKIIKNPRENGKIKGVMNVQFSSSSSFFFVEPFSIRFFNFLFLFFFLTFEKKKELTH